MLNENRPSYLPQSSPYFISILFIPLLHCVAMNVSLTHQARNDHGCNLRLNWSWILPFWVNEMHSRAWLFFFFFLQYLALVPPECVWHCLRPSQPFLLGAEEQRKQMELPVV